MTEELASLAFAERSRDKLAEATKVWCREMIAALQTDPDKTHIQAELPDECKSQLIVLDDLRISVVIESSFHETPYVEVRYGLVCNEHSIGWAARLYNVQGKSIDEYFVLT